MKIQLRPYAMGIEKEAVMGELQALDYKDEQRQIRYFFISSIF